MPGGECLERRARGQMDDLIDRILSPTHLPEWEGNVFVAGLIGEQSNVLEEQAQATLTGFETLDTAGVGWLVRLASWTGRERKPGLKLGVCGEHGGDPTSISWCHEHGLTYVSCSPLRVPVARLAAAQAALGQSA